MRRYTLYDRLTAIAAGLCLCWLFAACGEDRGGDLPDDDPNPCVVTITLRTSRPARPTQTKAGEMMTKADADTWEEEESVYERDITDWLVLAYDVEGGLAGYQSSDGTWTPGTGKEDDSYTSVEMRLPVGTYNFCAFANLKSLEGGEELYASITNPETSSIDYLGQEVKLLAEGKSGIDFRSKEPGKFAPEQTLIPMSSYAQVHTLSPAPEANAFEIPLIRMIGKVQVEITNNLDQPITVNQLDIMNLRKGSLPIRLLPWGENKYLETAGNEGAERQAPNLPGGETVADEDLFNEEIIPSETPGEDRVVPAKDGAGGSNNNIKTYTRYIPEGNAGAKEILLGVDIEGRPRTEHTTSFGFVRRNDLLVIPVLITEIETKLEVAEQRLPIGVYPTALVYGEKTGVQILTPVEHTLQAAGDLSIRFEISKIDGVEGDFEIKGLPQDGEVPETAKFSSIQVESNEKRLITAVNGADCGEKRRFYLPATSIVTKDGKSGSSFTIRTQELGGKGDATIILTLVINYGENMAQEMQIPYTIQIRNYQKEQQP